MTTTDFLTFKLIALRRLRDSLLREKRDTKATPAWQTEYGTVLADFDAANAMLTELRWAKSAE